MLPEAYISHKTAERLRIKIPSKKGDEAFFSSLKGQYSQYQGSEIIEMNIVTGSLLFLNEKGVDLEAIRSHAEANSLFTVLESKARLSVPAATPIAVTVTEPVEAVNRNMIEFTGGRAGIATLAFLYLFGAGIYQVSRGKTSAPPWYTALWYAFDIFQKAGLRKSG